MTTWPVDTEDRFLAFYEATVREAFRYASRLVGGDRVRAEDLVQDVYVSLLRKAKSGTMAEVGVGWVLVALRHRFLDVVRATGREDRRLRLVSSRPDGIDDEMPGPALADIRLSDRERAALTLRYIDDLPVADVAAALGTTVRATESLLARAKARVRAEVRDG